MRQSPPYAANNRYGETMLITDYIADPKSIIAEYAVQCGVKHAVIRLPDDGLFDFASREHWKALYDDYSAAGLKPVAVEPLPNSLHNEIKEGGSGRDRAIETLIKMFAVMDELDIRVLCFNFMAYIGWTRTTAAFPERGGARVTGFKLSDFTPPGDFAISEERLWENYFYFIKAVLPAAERYNIKLALHPDDPPLQKLGNVSRIMISFDNINRAVSGIESPNLGVTMCQACYRIMGENLPRVIRHFAERRKIFFVHFRDVAGDKYDFHETFHDNGMTDMAAAMRLYHDCGVGREVPIRVDHVPAMAGEEIGNPGYDAIGRLYAIGYLRGLLEAVYGGGSGTL